MANKYRTDGTTLKVDDLLRKLAIPRLRRNSIAVAAGFMQTRNSTGLQGNTVEQKKKEDSGQVSIFRNNFLRKFTFNWYRPLEQIHTGFRTVRNLTSCRSLIMNPDINSNLTTINSSSTLRTIKKFSNRILIQAPSYPIFEACGPSQYYSKERTGDEITVVHSKRIQKILTPSSVLCSMP